MEHATAATSSSNSSYWSLFNNKTQIALRQFFSFFNKEWVKGHPCTHGVIVQTRLGPVRGKTFTMKSVSTAQNDGTNDNFAERRVNVFLAIPYAKAGTFKERFKKPFPVKPWSEPMDCTHYGPRAIQHDMFWDHYITPIRQSESDCLHISVFTPEWRSSEFSADGRPVMVFIHGGGFLIHSAANYGDWNICQNLCLFDVVVCIVQYRLGLLGFFSTGDERCPGNLGLWDQLTAFQWIKENIATFGGDPNNVTAFGQSAGAAAIDLLSLSPLSKGLFRRLILMGGNASTDWAVVKPERTQAAACRIARRLGWRGLQTDLDSLLSFLRAQSAHKLAAPLVGKSAFNRHRKGLELCPVIDGHLIPAPVQQLRKQMDGRPLEVIIGGTEFEALLFLALGRRQSDVISLRKYLQIHIPSELPNAEALRKRCEHIYLDGIDINNTVQMSTAFLRLHSDLMMNNAVQRYCQGMLQTSSFSSNQLDQQPSAAVQHKIYLYNMTHFNKDEFGFIGMRMPFYAATHCHDLRYLVGKGLYSKFRPNWDDKQMMHIVGTLFTNFVKYGNPNTHWTKRAETRATTTLSNMQDAYASSCRCSPWLADVIPGDNNNSKLAVCCCCCCYGTTDTQNFDCYTSKRHCDNCWQPLTAEDTYRHMELCLEPRMQSDYQGKRYEFWRHELNMELQAGIAQQQQEDFGAANASDTASAAVQEQKHADLAMVEEF